MDDGAAGDLTHGYGVAVGSPWLSALILIAGVVAFITVKVGGSDDKTSPAVAPPAQSSGSGTKTGSGTKAGTGKTSNGKGTATPAAAKPAKFDTSARQVAGKFILTAVQRKHLDQAWKLTGPQLKVDTTYKQWLSGNISVVPFLDPLAGARFKVKGRTPTTVDLLVLLYAKNTKVLPISFDMTLQKLGSGKSRHWVVNKWYPTVGGGVVPNSGEGSTR